MSEHQGYSGNEFHTDLDLDTMITRPSSNEHEVLCFFPETIIVVKDMWVRVNGLDNVMPIRTGLSQEGTNHYREIEFSLRHNVYFNPEAHKKLRDFLYRQNCIAHGNGFNVQNTELLTRNYFSLVALPPPAIPKLNSGTGSRNRSAQNTYTDQEIASMSATRRVAHMLYLALSKMNVAVAELFTVEDLVMVAALLLVLQVTPEGWALDTALLGMAFAYAWFDGIKAVSMLVQAVSMAASANNNDQIDQAATMAAKGAVHLGLDIIIAFVVHKQIGTGESTPIKAKPENKETANNDDYVKHDFGQKPVIPKEITTADLLKQSTATKEELTRHLEFLKGRNLVNQEEINQFTNQGIWPEGINIPRSSEALLPNGNINWPLKDGFVLDGDGMPILEKVSLPKGTIIDRYGHEFGNFTSPLQANGKPYEFAQRAMSNVYDPRTYHQYEAIGDLTVSKGEIAPAFGDPGGGIQYKLDESVNSLIKKNILKEIPVK